MLLGTVRDVFSIPRQCRMRRCILLRTHSEVLSTNLLRMQCDELQGECLAYNMETLYGAETSIVNRETCRRNMMIRLNEGKNCIGTDTFGELINDRTVKMKKSKDIKSKSPLSRQLSQVSPNATSSARSTFVVKTKRSHRSRQHRNGLG
jgi:hypothetical protein